MKTWELLNSETWIQVFLAATNPRCKYCGQFTGMATGTIFTGTVWQDAKSI
jgi:hypothetical protein